VFSSQASVRRIARSVVLDCSRSQAIRKQGSGRSIAFRFSVAMPNSGMKRIPDRLEVTGATCCFLDPMRVRIITDTWNKTDRRIK
jgi:hypothetical protein